MRVAADGAAGHAAMARYKDAIGGSDQRLGCYVAHGR